MDLRERGSGSARHPWEVARAHFFHHLIADHVDLGAVSSILDVGAGDGWFAHELVGAAQANIEITCWDVNYRSEELAAPVGAKVTRTAIRPQASFDLVLVLDVLEHVDGAETFLADSIMPSVSADGVLIVSVPAHPWLFSAHDRMLHHHRRYRRRDLLAMLGRHVEVVAAGPLFTSLLLPRAVNVCAERLGRTSRPTGVGEWSAGALATRAFTSLLGVDAAVGRWLAEHHLALPGLSIWAVCRRSGE